VTGNYSLGVPAALRNSGVVQSTAFFGGRGPAPITGAAVGPDLVGVTTTISTFAWLSGKGFITHPIQPDRLYGHSNAVIAHTGLWQRPR
jgi:hypothetical protein